MSKKRQNGPCMWGWTHLSISECLHLHSLSPSLPLPPSLITTQKFLSDNANDSAVLSFQA